MIRKICVYGISCLCVLLSVFPHQVGAQSQERTLIIYQGTEEGVRMVDSLVGHFTDMITVIQADKVEALEEFSHVVYVGMDEEKPNAKLVALLDKYTGPVFFIGQHMEDFDQNHFLQFDGEESMTSLSVDGQEISLDVERTAYAYHIGDDAEAVYKGKSRTNEFPVVFRFGKNYYAGVGSVGGIVGHYVGEALFSFFGQEKEAPVRALRLEDVHPKTDPQILKQIGEYLWKEKIPYMITVIPVYTNPETGEEVHLAQERELVQTLKYMQKHGASLILHGYKHQYRDSETGEGFEYWDVENERPIYQEKDEKALMREDFANEEEYEDFLRKGRNFEKQYIKRTVTQGVEELVEQGLYPLAFEAPHYAMSMAGYKELSHYFSTYIGELQISDQTYKASYTPLYESTPSFLHGMKLIPETLGYFDPEDPDVLQKIRDEATSLSRFSDSYLHAFYHPYLGLENLEKLVEEMKHDDSYEWFDLKKQKNHVATGEIKITSTNGEIQTEIPRDIEIKYFMKKFWWVVLPIILFIMIGLLSRRKKK